MKGRGSTAKPGNANENCIGAGSRKPDRLIHFLRGLETHSKHQSHEKEKKWGGTRGKKGKLG